MSCGVQFVRKGVTARVTIYRRIRRVDAKSAIELFALEAFGLLCSSFVLLCRLCQPKTSVASHKELCLFGAGVKCVVIFQGLPDAHFERFKQGMLGRYSPTTLRFIMSGDQDCRAK